MTLWSAPSHRSWRAVSPRNFPHDCTIIMQPPPRDQVESMLAEIIREYLSRSDSIIVPGLGTFAVSHRSSSIERTDAGEVRMRPPNDEIVFTPEY